MAKIVFLGSGNVATHLARALVKKGHKVLQVYSRTKQNARLLAAELDAGFTNDPLKLNTGGDIYIISLKDNALAEVAKKINFGKKLTVHTSGSVSMNVLKEVSENYGVFYPMQTFSKQRKIELAGIPFLIEANNSRNEKLLVEMAAALTGKANVYRMNSEERKVLHVAAVFVNNFPNHLFAIAEEILSKNRLPFGILKPLISETIRKIMDNSPARMQTGPAKRGDKKIIDEHLKFLDSYPEYKKIYRLISKSIADNQNVKRNL